MAEQLIVFDMDGVLVDVTDSYRETIVRVIEHFTGAAMTHPQIQDYKNQGGWNDDWKLSHHVIRQHGLQRGTQFLGAGGFAVWCDQIRHQTLFARFILAQPDLGTALVCVAGRKRIV